MEMQELKTLLSELVQIRSDGQNEAAVCDRIEACFTGLPVEVRRYPHGPGRDSMVITLPGRDRSRALCLVGHLDTVPVPDAPLWQRDPFGGAFDGAYLHGRGAVDMKGGAAAMVAAALAFLREGVLPPLDLRLCFTADEETSGMGVCLLRDEGAFAGAVAAVICEPTGLRPGSCEKGCLWLEVEALGLSSHGSRPELGVNAIDGVTAFAAGLRAALDSGETHPLLGRTTVSLTTLSGGVKTNVIPDAASATLDIRTLPGLKSDDVLARADQVARALEAQRPGLKLSLRVQNDRPSVAADPDSSFALAVGEALAACGLPGGEKGLYFYTDASQFIPQTGLPFVILGPGDDALCHKRDERIPLEEVAAAADCYRALIASL
ncbi:MULTISPECIES: M20 family metallopeptidase [Eubacteriales]|uniref:M20/M25/M40 family metallo-hydrolase n=1 Tax=Bittarella massiliensis (ex Durand et al. 2017) TaxID=1720313 RepID=A0AAQ1MEZ7_9FIRM|nr:MULTISPECIES: M20 family metallopeptidase [Eubacteriales]ERI99860.1 peptidase dimerization domain protein [Clostridium sp. ATCC 29733]MZL69421.1 M20/M25/M40 family metallo-hydrolase [Bittarella massiliensis (ex Durand et al. 2017)]MZL79037.1 M20/M25/M40 family metallo-hydrolase [Bittarella massiliensis (ex Durand et al. 2017)]SHG47059.1 succinyl-diaminopimelate desuccinylase [Bittarella massiliensis (ex Durand et al. 2017)]